MSIPISETNTFFPDKKTKKNQPHCVLNCIKKKNVSYHYNPDVCKYHYGEFHPMKPFRLFLTNNLIISYKLYENMNLFVPRKATKEEMTNFHSDDYIEFLQKIVPSYISNIEELTLSKFNIGYDCPIFEGIYDYTTVYTGASLDATRKLISGSSDIAINWSGGLHHAKKSEPSGFCYVNDIVLSILNLLRVHPRVMYIDIDLHHGDGVQEAFYLTDRVMTVSFHKYNGEFFPGTGSFEEKGLGKGSNYAFNIPLKDGIDDLSYIKLYKLIMEPLITKFQPNCIVQQCGADSLGHDRLGCFNLNIKAHGECLNFTKSFGVPMLVLGGGGYTPRNVSRLWCYETSLLNDITLDDKIPDDLFTYDWFAPDYSLHPLLDDKYENKNSKKYLEKVKQKALEQLRFLNYAPSIEMNEIPPDLSILTEEEDKAINDFNQEHGNNN